MPPKPPPPPVLSISLNMEHYAIRKTHPPFLNMPLLTLGEEVRFRVTNATVLQVID